MQKRANRLLLSVILILGVVPFFSSAQAQTVESTLEKLMVHYEEMVLQTYQEMQALDPVETLLRQPRPRLPGSPQELAAGQRLPRPARPQDHLAE